MRNIISIILLLSLQNIAEGEALRFFVLPKDAALPKVRSSLQTYQAQVPKLGAPVLEVYSLIGVDLINISSRKPTKELPYSYSEMLICVSLPSGFQEKFEKIAEGNIAHRVTVALGDRILTNQIFLGSQRADTTSFEIALGSTVTSEEFAQILETLRAMIKKSEANQALVPTPISVTPAAGAPVAPAASAAQL